VLKVNSQSQLIYQKALLSTELQQIFSNAPQNPTVMADKEVQKKYDELTNPKSEKIESKIIQKTLEGDWYIP
jgi:hypothetical protein